MGRFFVLLALLFLFGLLLQHGDDTLRHGHTVSRAAILLGTRQNTVQSHDHAFRQALTKDLLLFAGQIVQTFLLQNARAQPQKDVLMENLVRLAAADRHAALLYQMIDDFADTVRCTRIFPSDRLFDTDVFENIGEASRVGRTADLRKVCISDVSPLMDEVAKGHTLVFLGFDIWDDNHFPVGHGLITAYSHRNPESLSDNRRHDGQRLSRGMFHVNLRKTVPRRAPLKCVMGLEEERFLGLFFISRFRRVLRGRLVRGRHGGNRPHERVLDVPPGFWLQPIQP